MPSLDLLVVFVDVVEGGSITAAAGRRGVPKSTVSRSLTRLEDALGARLLERGARRVALTPEGKSLYAQAGPHLAGLREAAGAVGDRSGEMKGTLRLTAPVDFGEAFVGEMAVRFAARHPGLRVEVDLTARVVDLIGEGFDVAIRATRKVTDPTVVARALMNGGMHLFASPSYLARKGAPKTIAELKQHALVLFRPKEGASVWTLEGPSGTERLEVEGGIGGNEFSFMRSALRAGAGIGPLPSFVGGIDVEEGKLTRVLPEWEMPAATMWLVYPAAKHVPRRVKAFRDFALEWFRLNPGRR
ncbi:MAG: LysR family transcriptional regulator [Polyangiales bacterium]